MVLVGKLWKLESKWLRCDAMRCDGEFERGREGA